MASIAIYLWNTSDSPTRRGTPPLLYSTPTDREGAVGAKQEIHRGTEAPEIPEKSAEEELKPTDITTPSDTPPPDPRPRAYSPGHILVTVEADDWLNPEKLKFTDTEKRKIQEFANADSTAAMELEQSFHRKLNDLGNQIIEKGKYDGRVNEKEISDEERNKLPYLTEDWLNPIFVSWSGGFRTWVKIDLRKEDPALADLRIAGWEEQAAARARLRDYIAELARKR